MGVNGHILQFDNPLTMLQYRKTYEMSLRVLKREMNVLDWDCSDEYFSNFLTRLYIDASGFPLENNFSSTIYLL